MFVIPDSPSDTAPTRSDGTNGATAGQGINESSPRSLSPSAPTPPTIAGQVPTVSAPSLPRNLTPRDLPQDIGGMQPLSPPTVDPSTGGASGGGDDGSGGSQINKILGAITGLLSGGDAAPAATPIALPVVSQDSGSSFNPKILLVVAGIGGGVWYAHKKGWFGEK